MGTIQGLCLLTYVCLAVSLKYNDILVFSPFQKLLLILVTALVQILGYQFWILGILGTLDLIQ